MHITTVNKSKYTYVKQRCVSLEYAKEKGKKKNHLNPNEQKTKQSFLHLTVIFERVSAKSCLTGFKVNLHNIDRSFSVVAMVRCIPLGNFLPGGHESYES